MKSFITYTAIAALTALPLIAEAQGKGNGNGNGNGNKPHAAQSNGGGNGNGSGNGNGNGRGNGPKHDDANQRGVNNGNGHGNGREHANDGVDPARIAAGLATINGVIYLTPDVDFAAISAEDLAVIANCPPGLAKKNPPCVPPGLAKQGVTYDEWTGYDADALRGLFDERWTAYDPEQIDLQDTGLAQAEIEDIFGIPAAPEGQRYAVIDGRPVLLDAEDYDKLLTINGLATRPTISDGLPIATDAVLTQEELIARYGLPALETGQNYSVLDNQLIALPDQSYDLLQLIRILSAV